MDFSGFFSSLLAGGCFVMFMLLAARPLMKHYREARGREPRGSVAEQCQAAVLTVLFLAVAGLVLALLPVALKRVTALLLFSLPFLLAFLLRRRHPRATEGGDWFFLRAVLVLATLALALGHVRWPLPEALPDGAYVNKQDTTAVRIQRFTGNLPPDNVVSYVAMEYLARNISFAANAPILPGQQVTNRPVLAGLIALPIRLLLRPVHALEKLPQFEYVGQQWPDFRVLVAESRLFSVYLGVLVLLNALMLLAVGALMERAAASRASRWVLVLLYGSSPYFLFQTLFTWPKALAGFFIILAATAYWWHRRAVLAGALLGMAYLSHPYAIGYAVIAVAGLAVFGDGAVRDRLKSAVGAGAAFLAVICPWLVWTQLVVRLDSDLVTQNLLTGEMTPFAFLWMRVANTATAFLPMHLTNSGATFMDIFRGSAMNLTGAVGVLVLVAALVFRQERDRRLGPQSPVSAAMLAFFAAASVLLGCVFSAPAVPALHGAQALAALLLCACVHRAFHGGPVGARVMLYAQVALNLACWGRYFISMFALPLR